MKKALALVLALALALSLVACGGAPASTSGSTSGSASATATGGLYPGTADPEGITVNLASEPPEMNPLTTTDSTSMNVLRHIYQGMMYLDAEDNAVPGVAESYEVSEDGLTYTFKLKEGLTWSNGEPVTSADFVFGLRTFFTPETAGDYQSTWATLIQGAEAAFKGEAPVEDIGIEAPDEYTVVYHLNNPAPYFLSVLAFPSFFPINEKGWNDCGGLDGYGTEADKMVTNGAYNITEWQHQDHITLTKNDNYWNAAEEASIKTIKFVMIDDNNTALNGFMTGEYDMIGLSGQQKKDLEAEGAAKLGQYADGGVWYFEYNVTQPGLSNAKVRQALTMGIDIPSFMENIVMNDSKAANCFTPDAVKGADGVTGSFNAAAGDLIDHSSDFEAAKALLEEGLAEEGMTVDDLEISILTDTGDTAAKNCAFFQEQWKTNLGLTNVTVDQQEFQSRLDKMSNRDFSVVFAGWSCDYNDPNSYLDLWITGGGNNHTGWSNAEYDQYIADAAQEADPEAREELLLAAEKLLCEEQPIGPIYYRYRDYATSDKLDGVVRSAFQDMNFLFATIV